MKFREKGRTLIIKYDEELVCNRCYKKFETLKSFWYYWDAEKQLWCRKCVQEEPVSLMFHNTGGRGLAKYQFWLIDNIDYDKEHLTLNM